MLMLINFEDQVQLLNRLLNLVTFYRVYFLFWFRFNNYFWLYFFRWCVTYITKLDRPITVSNAHQWESTGDRAGPDISTIPIFVKPVMMENAIRYYA